MRLILIKQKDRPSNDTYGVRPGEKPYKMEIVWRNVILFIYLHCAALYAFTYPLPLSSFIIGRLIENFEYLMTFTVFSQGFSLVFLEHME